MVEISVAKVQKDRGSLEFFFIKLWALPRKGFFTIEFQKVIHQRLINQSLSFKSI